jgi:hypothetical protein
VPTPVREGTDVRRLLERPGTVLHEFAANVTLVEDRVTSGISSTKLREELQQVSQPGGQTGFERG